MRGGAFLNGKEGQVGFRKEYYDVRNQDIAFTYLEGYIHAKVTEHLLQGIKQRLNESGKI